LAFGLFLAPSLEICVRYIMQLVSTEEEGEEEGGEEENKRIQK
jgi:hypothetical protein